MEVKSVIERIHPEAIGKEEVTEKDLLVLKESSIKKKGTNYPNVRFRKDRNTWVADICVAGRKYHIGDFGTELDCAKARIIWERHNIVGGFSRADAAKKKPKLPDAPYKDDLRGLRFGHLLVVARADKNCHTLHWLCKCDCGGTITATTGELKKKKATSCGCVDSKHDPKKKRIRKKMRKYYKGGSSILAICQSPEPRVNNRCGAKGVYKPKKGPWYAKLIFQGVAHRVKCSSKEEAIIARRNLESVYFKPYLRERSTEVDTLRRIRKKKERR